MAILYERLPGHEHPLLLWGELDVVEHLRDLRVISLYWEGVLAEIEREGGIRDAALQQPIRDFLDAVAFAKKKLSDFDDFHEEHRNAQRRADDEDD